MVKVDPCRAILASPLMMDSKLIPCQLVKEPKLKNITESYIAEIRATRVPDFKILNWLIKKLISPKLILTLWYKLLFGCSVYTALSTSTWLCSMDFFLVLSRLLLNLCIYFYYPILCVYILKKNTIGIFRTSKRNDPWLIDFCVKTIISCVWSMREKKNVDEANKHRGCCTNKLYQCKSGFFDLDPTISFLSVRR